MTHKKILRKIYRRLYTAFGPRHWWPADSPLEVIVGAILTQNTAWSNVEKAIKNLKQKKLLNAKTLHTTDVRKIAKLIRPAGYYNLKAKRLKGFMEFLFSRYQGSLKRMFKEEIGELRANLLKVKGIGPETADSILLYAGNKPVFVVDAYTRRILSRHNLIDDNASYDEIQCLFLDNLPCDTKLFNEFHALIVQLGKEVCRKKPKCEVCVLREFKGRV